MYDAIIERYTANSDFHNFGFWNENTHDQKQASENLMEELLALLPNKDGTILDVACGKGASTRHLTRYYAPSNVTGINISEKQLQTCRVNAPECRFLMMDACDLDFDDESFDNIICVEAAFHFNTRQDFMSEAWRVLKPGGTFVLSDILFINKTFEDTMRSMTGQNYVADIEEYRSQFLAAGFDNVEVIDATQQCWKEFWQHYHTFMCRSLLAGEMSRPAFNRIMTGFYYLSAGIRHYVLVSARKPE